MKIYKVIDVFPLKMERNHNRTMKRWAHPWRFAIWKAAFYFTDK